MPEMGFLKDLVIILAAGVVVVALLQRVGVPVIAGFILTGMAVGPGALGWVSDTHEVEVLAEVGVVLLLFGIGLELSLARLRRLWRSVVLGGALQVGTTIGLTAVIGELAGLRPGSAVFLGCIVAVSSTAIVLRGLQRRGELDVPHGQLAVGILVFQDLCVVPMILAIPFLAGEGGSVGDAAIAGAKAVAVLVGVILAARLVVPRLLAFVARTRERDLFVLSVFLICLGIAWAASIAGVSLALGAFLAGLVVAGSEFRHRALTELIPAREVLASIFFVSVGMLLDVRDVLGHIAPIVGLLAVILVGKFLIVLGTALALRLPLRVGVLTATTLCQVGEFSFVLLAAASGTGLLGTPLSHNVLVAVILSMLLTPVAITFGPHLASRAARVPWLNRRLGVRTPGSRRVHDMAGHVIVAGYALAGEAVTGELRAAGVPHVAVDLNPQNVRRAREAGARVFLADVTHPEVLEEVGIQGARLLVIAINDPQAAERAIRTARCLREDLPIIVRAPYAQDETALRAAGSTEVVSAETEAAKGLIRATRAHLQEGG